VYKNRPLSVEEIMESSEDRKTKENHAENKIAIFVKNKG